MTPIAFIVEDMIVGRWVLGPLHTWDWEPVTITLRALSLVEKAEPLQVRFTLRLRDQQSMWMEDGCKVYTDSHGFVTTLHDFGRCLGTALGRFILGFHNFMVMALGSCVKWPLNPETTVKHKSPNLHECNWVATHSETMLEIKKNRLWIPQWLQLNASIFSVRSPIHT
jgi:hypothetical protein